MADSFVLDPALRRDPSPDRRTVLVTGAGGRIGSFFAEQYHDRYDLRLMVYKDEDVEAAEQYGTVVRGDITDVESIKPQFDGVDTVVHLAASPSPATVWDTALKLNIDGTYNVYVAARAAGCRRVVFASSIHAVSGYGRTRQVHADDPVNPGDVYGVSKCFGESMGRYMAEQQGLSVICIRIGAFQPLDTAKQRDSYKIMNAFVSKRDLAHLITCCIDNVDLRFAIVHGLSNNLFNRMDISETKMLVGYDPQDDFTELHPDLDKLDLRRRVTPHDEESGQESGIRQDL